MVHDALIMCYCWREGANVANELLIMWCFVMDDVEFLECCKAALIQTSHDFFSSIYDLDRW